VIEPAPPYRGDGPHDLHEKADIDLAVDDDLAALWQRVTVSTLDFSGSRLRNASMAR
jgi:hypothetical protein